MKNKVQLITYVDRLTNGGFKELKVLLEGPMKDLFGSVHALPFFTPIDGSDAGFDPSDHTMVDPRLGTWSDVKALSEEVDIMADLIVNHVSSDSDAFQDYLAKGEESEFAEMFLTYGKVFPNGATEQDLLAIYRPRPGFCFTKMRFADGTDKLVWTTFTNKQIDIDVKSGKGQAYLDSILKRFSENGIRQIRLDAAGYAIKKPGTSCFMTPDSFAFLGELAEKARALGMEVLVEVHGYFQDQFDIASKVDRVYDFGLPPLILNALYTGDAAPLAKWIEISPHNCLTVLDTHDGIGIIDVGPAPDGRPSFLDPDAIDNLVETMHAKTNGDSHRSTGAAVSNLDLYQINSTYFDVLGRDEQDYLIARAVQFFSPGIPMIYYIGLLGGVNDMELLARTQVGRDINRHYYAPDELSAALEKPMVKTLFELIRFRNTHPAFDGAFSVKLSETGALVLERSNGDAWAKLVVDFKTKSAIISHSGGVAEKSFSIEPDGLKDV